ncbi:MAG: hypothetical protein JW750_01065 [Anaerolineaceae bacterium]|nr:hypothetical protein [Anaerolineaceae bacterium]
MHQLPQWAPRVPQNKIQRLYELDAKGIADDELIDEVGYGLLARCESFIAAMNAREGRALCPNCGAVVEHSQQRDEWLHCSCGWSLLWDDYFKAMQHKQLSGAEHVLELFQTFVDQFPLAKKSAQKMLLIDQLIHGFHWYLQFGNTRPVAVNLIGGRLSQVIRFLDELTYGEHSSPGLKDNYEAWMKDSREVFWLRQKREREANE